MLPEFRAADSQIYNYNKVYGGLVLLQEYLIKRHRAIVPQLCAFVFKLTVSLRLVYAFQSFGDGQSEVGGIHHSHFTNLAGKYEI